MPAATELVAHDRNVDEIKKAIGADWLIYQDLDDLIAAVQEGNPEIKQFEASVFNNEYITGGVDKAYLAALEALRADGVKQTSDDEDSDMDLYQES